MKTLLFPVFLVAFVLIIHEPYRVCRRVNILRDYPDDKTKLYPEIRERAVQLLIESEKIILLLGQQSQLLLLKSVVLLKHCVFGI